MRDTGASVKPIPVAFHIGPLVVHTYGIGLAITFWFAYRYFAKRLRDNGYRDDWLGTAFIWIIVSAIVGARAVHVIANWNSDYSHNLSGILQIWNGGLTSFGGLALAFPVGLYITRKRCPELRLSRAADLVAPVLVVAWAIGRLLGPQLMVNGGGHPTKAWFGMQYANGNGGYTPRELPVPIFQSIECFIIFLIVLQVEKWTARHGNRPLGFLVSAAAVLWGASRFVDEKFWLNPDVGTDAVEIASIAFVVLGLLFMAGLVLRERRRGWGPPVLAPVKGEAEIDAGLPSELSERAANDEGATEERTTGEPVPEDVEPDLVGSDGHAPADR